MRKIPTRLFAVQCEVTVKPFSLMNLREQSKHLLLDLFLSLISVGKSSKPHVPLKIYILLNERERRATHLSERTEIGREGRAREEIAKIRRAESHFLQR